MKPARWKTENRGKLIIRVINLATDEESKEQIRSAYRKAFPKLNDDQFEFDGALKWTQEVSAIAGDHGA
jgi:hypothetical protein